MYVFWEGLTIVITLFHFIPFSTLSSFTISPTHSFITRLHSMEGEVRDLSLFLAMINQISTLSHQIGQVYMNLTT